MSCDEYYRRHELPPLGTPAYENRCRIHSIEANTARSVALLGASTTFFGVSNLFITGWMIKAWGIKIALLITTFWPAVRLLVQNIGVTTGAGLGILITQLSQITTIVGGPVGYLLALNSFATEVVLPSERTGTLGRLQGCAKFGTALGFLAGGLLEDWFSNIIPFRVALILFCLSTIYIFLFLPKIPLNKETEEKAKNLSSFFEPLRMFTPTIWMLRNGTIRREYGVLLLGMGAFLAVFATRYIPVLLQMYATDVFGFSASDNSELISFNFIIRAIFLTFAFPKIISVGRKWLDQRNENKNLAEQGEGHREDDAAQEEDLIPTEPEHLASKTLPTGVANADEPGEPLLRTITGQSTRDEENESFAFDLLYARYSLILDGVLTSLATFTSKGWHMYVVAFVIPLAAGTGSAAKGTMLQMCTPEQKTDALSAISLLELLGGLSTTSIFGLIFSGFAEIGRPSLTFAVNGAVAACGFVVLMFARFPPEGAVRYKKDEHRDQDATT